MKVAGVALLAALPLALAQSNSTTPGGPDHTTSPSVPLPDTSTTANYSSSLTTPTTSSTVATTSPTTTSTSSTSVTSVGTTVSSTSQTTSSSVSVFTSVQITSTVASVSSSGAVSTSPNSPSQVVLTTTAPGGVATMTSVKVVGPPSPTNNQPAASPSQTGTLQAGASNIGSSVRGTAFVALIAVWAIMGTL